MKNTSDLSFDSSEVSFDSSEEIFLASVENSHFPVSYREILRESRRRDNEFEQNKGRPSRHFEGLPLFVVGGTTVSERSP